jgi:hypothetical protein
MVPFSDTRWQRSRTEMAALAAAASKIQKLWRCNQLRDRFRTVVKTAVKRFCSHFDEGTEVDRGAVDDTGRSNAHCEISHRTVTCGTALAKMRRKTSVENMGRAQHQGDEEM